MSTNVVHNLMDHSVLRQCVEYNHTWTLVQSDILSSSSSSSLSSVWHSILRRRSRILAMMLLSPPLLIPPRHEIRSHHKSRNTGWPWRFDTRFCWLPFRCFGSLSVCHAISPIFTCPSRIGQTEEQTKVKPPRWIDHPVYRVGLVVWQWVGLT